jgi:antirestriction protein ArdC
MDQQRADIYTRITAEIATAIENGAGEWRMPWNHDGSSITRPRNVISDKGYRGINVLALWVAARRSRYVNGTWGTYRQWSQLGCQVRKGEKATTVVFWKQMHRHQHTDAGPSDADGTHCDEHEDQPRFFARGYYVFNAGQVDGYAPPDLPSLPDSERIVRADGFFAALNIPIITGGNEACYRPSIDTIFMPPFERFIDAAGYYSCLGHETGHATGAKHRLDRDLTGRFGSAKYAMDEVIVELTSSFIMADLGIAHRARAEHAAYIASWIEILKDDPRAILTAAGKAQAAADWMHAQQSRQMLASDGVDISTIAVPLAQPDQAMHRSELLRADNRANTHGGASHQGGRLHSHLAARR